MADRIGRSARGATMLEGSDMVVAVAAASRAGKEEEAGAELGECDKNWRLHLFTHGHGVPLWMKIPVTCLCGYGSRSNVPWLGWNVSGRPVCVLSPGGSDP